MARARSSHETTRETCCWSASNPSAANLICPRDFCKTIVRTIAAASANSTHSRLTLPVNDLHAHPRVFFFGTSRNNKFHSSLPKTRGNKWTENWNKKKKGERGNVYIYIFFSFYLFYIFIYIYIYIYIFIIYNNNFY